MATVCRTCRYKSKESHKWICTACKQDEDENDRSEDREKDLGFKHSASMIERGRIERIGTFWDSLFDEEKRQETNQTFQENFKKRHLEAIERR